MLTATVGIFEGLLFYGVFFLFDISFSDAHYI